MRMHIFSAANPDSFMMYEHARAVLQFKTYLLCLIQYAARRTCCWASYGMLPDGHVAGPHTVRCQTDCPRAPEWEYIWNILGKDGSSYHMVHYSWQGLPCSGGSWAFRSRGCGRR